MLIRAQSKRTEHIIECRISTQSCQNITNTHTACSKVLLSHAWFRIHVKQASCVGYRRLCTCYIIPVISKSDNRKEKCMTLILVHCTDRSSRFSYTTNRSA